MNTAQKAIIKKDFHEVWDIKMARASILVVPLVLVIVLPAVLLAVVILAPEEISSQELSSFLPLLPEEMRNTASPQVAFFYFANMIFQPFFLFIPFDDGDFLYCVFRCHGGGKYSDWRCGIPYIILGNCCSASLPGSYGFKRELHGFGFG